MKKSTSKNARRKAAEQFTPAILLDSQTPFAISEAFNQLRTNLMYATSGEETCPVFAITSVHESSGKSTIITNLALSFSMMGKKVLLVDGDMRCPTVYRFFGLKKKKEGLSELISGIVSDPIVRDIRPNLDVLTSGRIPPNPSELLGSVKLKELLAQWKSTYDIVFFDFPPMGVVSDAVIPCNEVSGYIFTILSGRDYSKNVNSTLEAMEQVGAKIAGIVLNDYNLKSSGYYHYKYNYKYRSKYASRYEKTAAEMQKTKEETEKE